MGGGGSGRVRVRRNKEQPQRPPALQAAGEAAAGGAPSVGTMACGSSPSSGSVLYRSYRSMWACRWEQGGRCQLSALPPCWRCHPLLSSRSPSHPPPCAVSSRRRCAVPTHLLPLQVPLRLPGALRVAQPPPLDQEGAATQAGAVRNHAVHLPGATGEGGRQGGDVTCQACQKLLTLRAIPHHYRPGPQVPLLWHTCPRPGPTHLPPVWVHPFHQVAIRVHLPGRFLLLEVAQQLQAVHCSTRREAPGTGQGWRRLGCSPCSTGSWWQQLLAAMQHRRLVAARRQQRAPRLTAHRREATGSCGTTGLRYGQAQGVGS